MSTWTAGFIRLGMTETCSIVGLGLAWESEFPNIGGLNHAKKVQKRQYTMAYKRYG